MIPDRRLITAAVLDLLVRGTGKQVGDHAAPDDPEYPYCILYTVDGGGFSGSLADPERDADLVYQVTSVGLRRDQAEWMADRVRLTMLARAAGGGFQVPVEGLQGWAVNDRRPEAGTGQASAEGQPPNQVFSLPERFIVSVTPA